MISAQRRMIYIGNRIMLKICQPAVKNVVQGVAKKSLTGFSSTNAHITKNITGIKAAPARLSQNEAVRLVFIISVCVAIIKFIIS